MVRVKEITLFCFVVFSGVLGTKKKLHCSFMLIAAQWLHKHALFFIYA